MELVNNCKELKLNTGAGAVIGIDIGSTTAKIVAVEDGRVVFECYERHFSQVRAKALELVGRARA